MAGTVIALHTAPEYGTPVVSVDRLTAVEGKGLQGDRYFGTTRQVTLVATGELAPSSPAWYEDPNSGRCARGLA